MSADTTVKVHFDGSMNVEQTEVYGGAVVFLPSGPRLCFRVTERHEKNTNNVGEWVALISALRVVQRLGLSDVQLFGDSALIICMVQGKCSLQKSPHFQPLKRRADALLRGLQWTITHVPREQNREADRTASSYRLFARGRTKPLLDPEAHLLIDLNTGHQLDWITGASLGRFDPAPYLERA